MDNPADTGPVQAPLHRRSPTLLQSESWRMCHGEGLYQIDLLNGGRTVSEPENIGRRKRDEPHWTSRTPHDCRRYHARQTSLKRTKGEAAADPAESPCHRCQATSFPLCCCGEGVTVKRAGQLSTSRQTGRKPITAGSWAAALTAPPSLPFWSRTPRGRNSSLHPQQRKPPEPPNRPQPYPNTLHGKGERGAKRRENRPRQDGVRRRGH